MHNWKLLPSNSEVAKYIDCYWFLETTESDVETDYRKLNPYHSAHLIITKADHLNRYVQEATTTSIYGSHLLLPHLKAIAMDHSRPFSILGVKFRVGALYTLTSIHRKVELDRIVKVSLDHLFGIEELIVRDMMLKASTDALESCKRLDESFARLLLGVEKDRHAQRVNNLLNICRNKPISEIGKNVGLSQRTIERSFLRVTGLTLKQYYSIEQLEALLDRVYKLDQKDISWADIAVEFGFSDQPHLIRYLKAQIGHTPQQYTHKRDLAIDSYGNFE